jgi:predicted metal-dependent enzyme (double-stranded beta helix superfamily)
MFALPCFIAACQTALRESEPVVAVRALMAEALQNPAALEAAVGVTALADSTSAQYDFLHQDAGLTVLHVTMPGRLVSPPHNHLAWVVIGMYRGQELNVFYRREGSRIVEQGRRTLVAPEVMALAPDVIHGIANPLGEISRALHVYGGALSNPARSLWNPFTLEEQPFAVPAMLGYERALMERGGIAAH